MARVATGWPQTLDSITTTPTILIMNFGYTILEVRMNLALDKSCKRNAAFLKAFVQILTDSHDVKFKTFS